MQKSRRLAAFITLASLAIACSSRDDAAGAPAGVADDGSLTIVATEFAFAPADVVVEAGRDIDVLLDNSGGMVEHDWVIDELSIVIYAAAGQMTEATVNVPVGVYEVYCSIPGHRAAGMVGTLRAEAT